MAVLTPFRAILKPLASLRLTVALFAMAIFLIFAGTLAQRELGTFEAMDKFFRSFYAWIELHFFVPQRLKASVPGGFPFPGGVTLVILLIVNLIAAHSVRFKLKWKQTGILLTHLGLIVLLGSELATGAFATEGNMSIDEGSYSHYIERMRDYELAVIDPSPADHNKTTVVPDSVLLEHLRQAKGPITHADLPFTIELHRWMANSRLARVRALERAGRSVDNPATAGRGRTLVARKQPSVAGTDTQQNVDQPAAYITLRRGGEAIGTYLVSTWLNEPQEVTVDGKTYQLSLRFEREYKPYKMHLEEFTHEQFTGTDTPKAFKSEIRLEDPDLEQERNVLIQMNEPLYYEGETFYQHQFRQTPAGETTVLQVVHNPAWMLPYVSCGMIGGGLLIHFGISLVTFLRRQL